MIDILKYVPFDLQCSDQCDVTTETKTAVCSTSHGKIYPDKFCKKSKLPLLVRDCKAPACEYLWYGSQWSEVNVFIFFSSIVTSTKKFVKVSFANFRFCSFKIVFVKMWSWNSDKKSILWYRERRQNCESGRQEM